MKRGLHIRWPAAHHRLLCLILLAGLLLMGLKTWLVLTLSGLAMGAMLFLMASGMTLAFGLLRVLNLAHGALISLGAFAGAAWWLAHAQALPHEAWRQWLALLPAMLIAMAVAGLVGALFERLVIRPVYGDYLKQMLVTVGGAIILVQLLQGIWGASPIAVPRPEVLRGSLIVPQAIPWLGGLALEKFRVLSAACGLVIYALVIHGLEHSGLGIVIRAGVEDREMVEALGLRMTPVFLAVFVLGAMLAGLGGMFWGFYQEMITAHMGDELLILVIVVIILGGLGSVRGCLYGALMVGLVNLYVGYLLPSLASVAVVGLMLAVLMWRPWGLVPVAEARTG